MSRLSAGTILRKRRYVEGYMASNVVRLADRSAGGTVGPEPIRAWLQQILIRGDGAGPFSIERLCRKAGTSPTNVSRFLKNGYPVPTIKTLTKIAAAVGVPTPGATLSVASQSFVDVPVIFPEVARLRGMKAAMAGATTWTRTPSKFAGCAAVKITAETGSLAGVLVGDLVVVDPDAVPAHNDLVVVALETGLAGVYRVIGPHLMPQAPGNLPALSLADSCVLGIARQVQRDLR
jgi:transcriptional regulator with XRE-family HTH domain